METAGQPETPGEATSSLRQAGWVAGPISPPGAEAGRGGLQLRGNRRGSALFGRLRELGWRLGCASHQSGHGGGG